jgi:uncharacterized repeat protein (TIGR04042 family)
VVYEYFKEGEYYTLEEFLMLSEAALISASERVRQRYGYTCSSAADQLRLIQNRIHQYKDTNAQGGVTVLRMNHAANAV